MEFINIQDYWTYQIPEWDNYEEDIIEEELLSLDEISIESYSMLTESDKWKIEYQGEEFVIINDLVHGCELRVYDEELIPVAQSLVRYLYTII